MGPYKGDFTTSDTVYVMFDSFSSDDPSASITLTGLAVTDIEIYKNGSTTQRASDAGYTLLDTDGIDFDTITGIHGFSIDLSDNTDAGFYTSGGEFDVIVSSVTIDGATINFHACSFSIDRIPKVNVAQILADAQSATDLKDFADAGYDPATNKVQGVVLVDTTTTNTDMVAAAPTAAANADAVWDELQSGHVGAGTFGEIATEIANILADTNELQTDDVPGLIAALNDPTVAAIADGVWDELQSGHVGAGTFGEIATEIASILADTNELQTDDVPGLIAALNDISTAQVNAEVLDVLNTDTFAELGTIPAATTTLVNKITFLYMLARNQVEQTSTTMTLRADDTTTAVGTASTSDNGTTATKGEFS